MNATGTGSPTVARRSRHVDFAPGRNERDRNIRRAVKPRALLTADRGAGDLNDFVAGVDQPASTPVYSRKSKCTGAVLQGICEL